MPENKWHKLWLPCSQCKVQLTPNTILITVDGSIMIKLKCRICGVPHTWNATHQQLCMQALDAEIVEIFASKSELPKTCEPVDEEFLKQVGILGWGEHL